jgi:hypothetical protein
LISQEIAGLGLEKARDRFRSVLVLVISHRVPLISGSETGLSRRRSLSAAARSAVRFTQLLDSLLQLRIRTARGCIHGQDAVR